MQHLLATLHRLDLLIGLHLLRLRRQHKLTGPREFVACIFRTNKLRLPCNLPRRPLLALRIEQKEQVLRDRLAETNKSTKKLQPASMNGIMLHLPLLANIFELTAFEIDCLVICLTRELDLKYEKLYAYLQDDVTQKRPTVTLFLDLLCRSFEAPQGSGRKDPTLERLPIRRGWPNSRGISPPWRQVLVLKKR